MSKPQPLVCFYDLSGPKPGPAFCWVTRFTLNFKEIPYETVKIGYPAIKPKCEELFGDMTGLEATVPIIEILQEPYKTLNNSSPIARLLNEQFPEKDGYKEVELINETDAHHAKEAKNLGRTVGWQIAYDVWLNSLDKDDGSADYYKATREIWLECDLKDLLEARGGEEKNLEDLKVQWQGLRKRMSKEDGRGEPTYLDFYDAAHVKYIEAASEAKAAKLMDLFGDDTFTKLLKKAEPYSAY